MSFTIIVLMYFWLSGLGPDKIELYSPYCEQLLEQGIIKDQSISEFVDEDHVLMVEAIKNFDADPLLADVYLEFLVYAREFIEADEDEYQLLLEILNEGAQPL